MYNEVKTDKLWPEEKVCNHANHGLANSLSHALEPACASKKDMFLRMMKKSKGSAGGGGGNSSAKAFPFMADDSNDSKKATGDGDGATSTDKETGKGKLTCPPDRDEIGSSSWVLVSILLLSAQIIRSATL